MQGYIIAKVNDWGCKDRTMNEKLNEHSISELLKVKFDGNLHHRESQYLEFKESFNFAGLADYYRDFAAFANNRGGYLIFGVKDHPKRELIGLSNKAKEQFDKLDPEKVSGNLLNLFSGEIDWQHEVFYNGSLWFAAFYVNEARSKPIICKKDDGNDQILKSGEIYYRYGGRTQKIQYSELEMIINQRVEQNNKQWLSLVQKIGKSGPQNAAILDAEKGIIEKNDDQILVIDEQLIRQINFVKEGEFSEKSGAKTLKLIGTVQPMTQIEVIKKEKEDLLAEYPLTATELVSKIKSLKPAIKQHDIYKLIAENNLKHNSEYSSFVFINKKAKDKYEKEGTLPQSITCVYKESLVNFIINALENNSTTQV